MSDTAVKQEEVKISLPLQRIPATALDPVFLILYGPSKVGKTTMLSKLDKCLILDLERGTKYLDSLAIDVIKESENAKISQYEYLKEITKSLYKQRNNQTYKYVAIDTIDVLVEIIERKIIQDYNIENANKEDFKKIKGIGEIPYGAGYERVRRLLLELIENLKLCNLKVIGIGHRKETIVGEGSTEITAKSLDLSGKLRNILMANADTIGYIYREKSDDPTEADNVNVQKLLVSFKTDGSQETGSRITRLAGKIIEFNWKEIYKES